MNKIERNTNWCSIDTLDGTQLTDGETLIVKWPDGQLQQLKVSVESGTFEIGEQGGNYSAQQSHAYVLSYHRGVQVRVPLYGLEAQRVLKDA